MTQCEPEGVWFHYTNLVVSGSKNQIDDAMANCLDVEMMFNDAR